MCSTATEIEEMPGIDSLIDWTAGAATVTEPIQVPVQLELIAELKASKDISGIKKLKVERAKIEVQHEQSQAQEFEKQFTSENFLDKVTFKSTPINFEIHNTFHQNIMEHLHSSVFSFFLLLRLESELSFS